MSRNLSIIGMKAPVSFVRFLLSVPSFSKVVLGQRGRLAVREGGQDVGPPAAAAGRASHRLAVDGDAPLAQREEAGTWLISVNQMTTRPLPAGLLAMPVWGRWRDHLAEFGILLIVVLIRLVESSAAFCGLGHPAAVTELAVLILSRAWADSPEIVLFFRYLDRRAFRQPTAQIGALGGVASVVSAIVNSVGALALFMPLALRNAESCRPVSYSCRLLSSRYSAG